LKALTSSGRVHSKPHLCLVYSFVRSKRKEGEKAAGNNLSTLVQLLINIPKFFLSSLCYIFDRPIPPLPLLLLTHLSSTTFRPCCKCLLIFGRNWYSVKLKIGKNKSNCCFAFHCAKMNGFGIFMFLRIHYLIRSIIILSYIVR